jgi:hypothetical protein
MVGILGKVGAGVAAAAAAPVVGAVKGSKDLIVDATKAVGRSINPFHIISASLGGIPGGGVISSAFKDVYEKLIGNTTKLAKTEGAVKVVEGTKKSLERLEEETKKNNKLMTRLVEIVVKMIRGTSESRFRKIEDEREATRRRRLGAFGDKREAATRKRRALNLFGGGAKKGFFGTITDMFKGLFQEMTTSWAGFGMGLLKISGLLFLARITGLTAIFKGLWWVLKKSFLGIGTLLVKAGSKLKSITLQLLKNLKLDLKGAGVAAKGGQLFLKKLGIKTQTFAKATPKLFQSAKSFMSTSLGKFAGKSLPILGWAWLGYDAAKELKEGSIMVDRFGEGKGFDEPITTPPDVKFSQEDREKFFKEYMQEFVDRPKKQREPRPYGPGFKPQVEGSLKTPPAAATIKTNVANNLYDVVAFYDKKKPMIIYNDNSLNERVIGKSDQNTQTQKPKKVKVSTNRPINKHELA